ncbi:MAG: universal stress protein [Candidatus Desulfofervidaceae bacterium]|nr:universal stress protein [Candidatus Desulfofervidaceae bacterium]
MAGKLLTLIDHSLEASYALRFACVLGQQKKAEVQAMHVIQYLPAALAVGSGWARRHWEKEQIEQMEREIERMVSSEGVCKNVNIVPLVTMGSVSSEVLNQLKKESYGMVISGVHYSKLSQKPYLGSLHTHLIEKSPYPIALVTSFKPVEKILLFLDDTICLEKTKDFLKRFFNQSPVLTLSNSQNILDKIEDVVSKELVKEDKIVERIKSEASKMDVIIIVSGNLDLLVHFSKEILPETLGAIVLFR